MGDTEICSYILVLKGKIGKEIPESSRLEFLEKLLANNFALSDAEGNTFRLFNRDVADLLLLRTLLAILKKSWELVFVLLRCSFGSFKNTFAMITVFLKRTLDSEDLFCCYKWKRWFLWTMAAVQGSTTVCTMMSVHAMYMQINFCMHEITCT